MHTASGSKTVGAVITFSTAPVQASTLQVLWLTVSMLLLLLLLLLLPVPFSAVNGRLH
jgi:multisubunit Na+/H+ antiporter MnhG subunit